MSLSREEAFLALSLIPQLGPIRLRALISRFGSPERILTASTAELRQVRGMGPQLAEGIRAWESQVDLAREQRRMRELGAHPVTMEDEEYPERLREIHDAPVLLYVQGQLTAADRHSLGVVGSRVITRYGEECAHRFCYHLAQAGMTIVSGLALGVDTEAHKAALAAQGRTVAIVGSGLGNLYPPDNAELAARIADGHGAVISELPMDQRPDRTTFPMRNRLISGMTEGVLVIEAGAKSGALITATQAAEQGRSVFAIPGPVNKQTSTGCNRLIQDGAKLVMEPGEILADLETLFAHVAYQPRRAFTSHGDGHDPDEIEAPAAPSFDPELIAGLADEQRAILEAIGSDECHVDEIIEKCHLPSAKVFSTLLALEMRQLVTQLPGSVFVCGSGVAANRRRG